MKNTLFLDRDGVINERLPGDYVRRPDAFVPLPGAIAAIAALSVHFQRIVVVTNQAGIGKGLMAEADLSAVHTKLIDLVQEAGGRFDGIYYCPHRADEGCACRKPAVGMGLRAQRDHPDVDFAHAWMVGDSVSDIQFGQQLGMKTALVLGKMEEKGQQKIIVPDFTGQSLADFAEYFQTFVASY